MIWGGCIFNFCDTLCILNVNPLSGAQLAKGVLLFSVCMLPRHLADYIFPAQKFIVSLIDNSHVYFLCYFPESPCLCPYLKGLYQWFTLAGSKFLIGCRSSIHFKLAFMQNERWRSRLVSL